MRDALRVMGHDVVRQSPAKDGLMWSDEFYIRDRKRRFCVADGLYAIRSIHEAWNSGEAITLTIHGDMPHLGGVK